MSYNQQELIFTDSKIYYIEKNGEERQVMMDWEDELMKNLLNMFVKMEEIF